jgi:hypothetical protein
MTTTTRHHRPRTGRPDAPAPMIKWSWLITPGPRWWQLANLVTGIVRGFRDRRR